MAEHKWALGWPGNHCTVCGLDDPIEAAIVCPDCHTPYGPEDPDQEMRLCPVHAELAATPCAAAQSFFQTEAAAEVLPRSSGGVWDEDRRLTPDDLAKIEAWWLDKDPLFGVPGHVRLLVAEVRESWAAVSALRQRIKELEAPSGGAPNEPDGLTFAELDAIEAALNRGGARSVGSINTRVLVNELRRARTQVSALRQQLDDAEQEEAFLVRPSDSRNDELLAARQEAETLRKQLDEAEQAASDANEEEASVRRALDSQALDYDALAREAETLRVAAPREPK
jgi:hypothetical protein